MLSSVEMCLRAPVLGPGVIWLLDYPMAIKCLLGFALVPVIVALRFYLKGRKGGPMILRVPANLTPPEPSSNVRTHHHPKQPPGGYHTPPLLDEERVYADVLPFVRIYQGFWLAGVVFLGLYLVYGWLTGVIPPLGTYLIALAAYTAVFLWVSVAHCRMSRPFGCIMLLVSAGLCLFSLIPTLLSGLLLLSTFGGVGGYSNLHLVISRVLSFLFYIPFGYLYYRAFRAGFWFALSTDETKQIVSEIDPSQRFWSGWFSKALAIPIPIRHLRRNRALSAALFIVSSLAFSSFAFLTVLCVAFSTILIASLPGLTEPSANKFGFGLLFPLATTNKFGFNPWVVAGLAIAALPVALAARAGARRLMISSIRESQEHDLRPSILFLRSFRDEQVNLPTARSSLLGRLVNLFQAKGNLDVVLLEEGTAYGPVVAVGEPGEPVPPYGASRGYFSDGSWQNAVAQLARDSRCIVICLDETEGVMWELEHILACGYGPKTLFVMNPGARELKKNKALVQEVIARTPNAPHELLSHADVPVLGFFFDEGQHIKVGLSTQFSEASYLLMVRWFLRTAMDGYVN